MSSLPPVTLPTYSQLCASHEPLSELMAIFTRSAGVQKRMIFVRPAVCVDDAGSSKITSPVAALVSVKVSRSGQRAGYVRLKNITLPLQATAVIEKVPVMGVAPAAVEMVKVALVKESASTPLIAQVAALSVRPCGSAGVTVQEEKPPTAGLISMEVTPTTASVAAGTITMEVGATMLQT